MSTPRHVAALDSNALDPEAIRGLLRALGDGDRNALAQLYARYGSLVFRTARRLTGNRADAEDVTQDVEPDETRKWVDRLVREHPDDPRALRDLAESLHDIELKPVDRIADSIRPFVPVLDSLRRLRPGARPPERAIYLVQTYGDPETRAQWPENAGMPLGFVFRALSDRALDTTASSVAYARRIASASCDRPAGKLALNMSTAFYAYVCTTRKAATWSYLSLVSLAKGNAAEAISLADSGRSLAGTMCNANAPTRARARARLASGDTVGAAHDYAVAYGQLPRAEEGPDALAARLGTHVRRAEFDSISRSTNRTVQACERARAAANLARRTRDR